MNLSDIDRPNTTQSNWTPQDGGAQSDRSNTRPSRAASHQLVHQLTSFVPMKSACGRDKKVLRCHLQFARCRPSHVVPNMVLGRKTCELMFDSRNCENKCATWNNQIDCIQDKLVCADDHEKLKDHPHDLSSCEETFSAQHPLP